VILKGWTSDKLMYQGKYFQVQNLLLTPTFFPLPVTRKDEGGEVSTVGAMEASPLCRNPAETLPCEVSKTVE